MEPDDYLDLIRWAADARARSAAAREASVELIAESRRLAAEIARIQDAHWRRRQAQDRVRAGWRRLSADDQHGAGDDLRRSGQAAAWPFGL
jgi:hypothetical protein